MIPDYGEIAYEAYGESVGWVNFQGDDMPAWDHLPAKIQKGWRDAAEAVRSTTLSKGGVS